MTDPRANQGCEPWDGAHNGHWIGSRMVFGVEATWDVVIVGAGPAGASAALGALAQQPNARVLMLDRAPIGRDKSCGDGIAPHAIDVLAAVGGPTTFAGHPPIPTLELRNGHHKVVRDMRRPALVVPRVTFDAAIATAALERGAEMRRCHVRTVEQRGAGVLVNGHIEARTLIAADGAHSTVRRLAQQVRGHQAVGRQAVGRQAVGRQAVGRQSVGRYAAMGAIGEASVASGGLAMALRGYAPTRPERVGRQVIQFGHTRQPSYAWSFDRGDGWANIGYGEVLHRGRSRRPLSKALMIEQVESMLPGSTIGAQQWLGHHLPLSARHFTHPAGPVLYVGDAASLINPLTGEGIYYALATGAMAGVCAAQQKVSTTAASAYRAAVRALLGRHLATTAFLARAVQVPGLLNAGLRASAQDQRVFDDLVEVGLGRGTITARLSTGLIAGAASSTRR